MSRLRPDRPGPRIGLGGDTKLRPGRAIQAGPAARHEARTADMDAVDLDRLERWASRFPAGLPQEERPPGEFDPPRTRVSVWLPPTERAPADPPPVLKMEAGLRVCPRCGKPLHISATVCRACGEPVPKR